MATSSEVKSGLDEIAKRIANSRQTISGLIITAQAESASLDSLATGYADLIATINAYGTADAFESVSKAELAKLSAEYTALKADADTIAAVSLTD